MGLARYTIWKYVKTSKGRRYCSRPPYSANNKIKLDVVFIGGKEEVHPEGSYYLNIDDRWEKVVVSAVEVQDEQRKRSNPELGHSV